MSRIVIGLLGGLGWFRGAMGITDQLFNDDKIEIDWHKVMRWATVEWTGFFIFALAVHLIVTST